MKSKSAACLVVCVVALLSFGPSLVAQGDGRMPPDGRPHPLAEAESGGLELLMDEEWVDRKEGIRRVLGEPIKQPGGILRPDKPWESAGVTLGMSLLFDNEEGKFKLWYLASVGPRVVQIPNASSVASEATPRSKRTFLCYAESQDGVRWVRPALGRVAFEGSTGNNIVREIFFPGGVTDTVFYNVVKDTQDRDPAKRYKAIGFQDAELSLLADRRDGGRGVCVAYSPDGFNWSEPALVMDTQDVTDADSLFPEREPSTGKWTLFLRPRVLLKRRFIGYAESRDFERWTYPRMLITPDSGDDEWVEFYGLAARLLGRWRAGLMWVYHNNPAFSPMTNELVYSRDGLRWRRAMPGRAFLPLGEDGSFDSRMISPMALIPRGREIFIYYWGSNAEHGADRGLETMQEGRVDGGGKPDERLGLARLPWGQFTGLRADLDGMVETKWITNYGKGGVRAIAAIEKTGLIQAEILDQYGNVIPGWTRKESQLRMLEDDRGKVGFFWGREDLVGRQDQAIAGQRKIGRVVKLRFYLHKATLYGFEIGEAGAMPAYVNKP